jgi:hypothetical protein
MAPLAVKGKVLFGNSGGEFGIRGWLTALDACHRTDRLARLLHRPGCRRVLIGPRFRLPTTRRTGGKDLGISTWPGGPGRAGGRDGLGLPLLRPASRPSSSTAPPTPAPGTPSCARGTTSGRPASSRATRRRRRRSGSTSGAPTISYDHDGVNENVLVDLTLHGTPRKVLLHPDRNGHLYVLGPGTPERCSPRPSPSRLRQLVEGRGPTDGRLLPRGRQGAAHRPGRPRDLPGRRRAPRTGSPRPSLPAPASSTSPTRTSARTRRGWRRTTSRARPSWARNVRFYARSRRSPGASSPPGIPSGARIVWQVHERSPCGAGPRDRGRRRLLRDDGGLVQGPGASHGQGPLALPDGSGGVGQPVSYRGPDGHQYVAVLSGIGAGRERSCPAGPRLARRHGRGGWGGAPGGPGDVHEERRNALRLRPAGGAP